MIKSQIKEALLEKGYFNNKLTDYGINIWRHFIYGDYSEMDYRKALEMQKEEINILCNFFLIVH